MRQNKLAFALSFAMLAVPLSAMAQDSAEAAADQPAAATEEVVVIEEEGSNLSWNLSFTSNYVFRGVTQTDNKAAIQGGLDYAFGDSGFYVGTWASNIDFNDTGAPNIELDGYVGYSTDFSDDWNIDVHAVRYFYFGDSDAYGSIDYNEYFATVTYAEMIGFTVAYSDDYANLGYDSTYYQLTGSFDLGNDFALNAGYGYSTFGGGNGSYDDYNLGISRQFGPANIALNYYDTSTDALTSYATSDNWVLSISFGN